MPSDAARNGSSLSRRSTAESIKSRAINPQSVALSIVGSKFAEAASEVVLTIGHWLVYVSAGERSRRAECAVELTLDMRFHLECGDFLLCN